MNRDKSRRGLTSCRVSFEPQSRETLTLLTSALWCPWTQAAGRQTWKGVSISGLSRVETPSLTLSCSNPTVFLTGFCLISLTVLPPCRPSNVRAGLSLALLNSSLSPCLPIALARGVYSKKSSREGGYQVTPGWKCCLFLGPYLLTPLLI